MKKVFTAFILLSISLASFAQNEGDLENQFYFRFGYSLPVGNYLSPVDSDNVVDWSDTNRFGTSFELGSIFMLNGIPMPDGLRLGVNVDYLSTSYHRLTGVGSSESLIIWKLAAKLGLSFSYSPVQGLVFDSYFKAHIPAVALMWEEDYIDDLAIATRAIGYATGINIRYTFLMMGVEFNTVNMIFEDTDGFDYPKVALPNLNFIFGFSF
jgi:hypothetical protein